MHNTQNAAEFVDRLTTAWPPEEWRDLHVLIAVSGGADSMALMRGLLELKQRSGGTGRIYAAHVNHQLRGEGSDADEQWLRRECERLDVPLLVERTDAAALADAQGDGVEAAARESRYRLLTGAAETIGARFVALGHTRDDQAETILFRILRGTGLRGLAGIPAMRRLSPSVSAVRPMLGMRREDVLRFLEGIGQAFCDDASNAQRDFARNRLRHELLPLVRDQFNHEVDSSLVHLGEQAAEVQEVVEELAAELLARCRAAVADGQNERGGIMLATGQLVGVRELLVGEVLRQAWREAGFGEQGMTRDWWRRLAQFAQAPGEAASLNLPGNVRATRPADGLLAVRAVGLP